MNTKPCDGYLVNEFTQEDAWYKSYDIFETFQDAIDFIHTLPKTDRYQTIEKIWLEGDYVHEYETVYGNKSTKVE